MNSKQTKEIAANILRTVEEMQKRNDVSMITVSYADKTSCSFIPSTLSNYSIAVNEIIVAAQNEAEAINKHAAEIEENEDSKALTATEFNETIIAANNSIKQGDYITGISLLKSAIELTEEHKEAIEQRITDLQANIISGI